MPWINLQLTNQQQVSLFLQGLNNECGPACVATVCRLLGKNTDIEPARRALAKFDGSDDILNPGAGIFKDWDNEGAYIHSCTQALSYLGIKSAWTKKNMTPGEFTRFCTSRTPQTPAIIGVDWFGGEGHYIVVLGRPLGQNYIEVLDPGINLVQNVLVPAAGAPLANYNVNYPGQPQAGTFSTVRVAST